jgi:glycosyltransferase involved in cell wall biosynthesis
MIKPGISACIMVRNEEKNLPELFANLKDVVDEIVVIDHESTDSTIELLKKNGARILPRPNATAENWSDVERSLLNQNANHEWILHIDADERLTEEARKELPQLAKQNDYDVIWLYSKHFYAPRRYYRYGFYAPHLEPRFYRRSCETNWRVKIHEKPIISGRHFYSKLSYDHLYYTAGVERIKAKHETYIEVERLQKSKYLTTNPFLSSLFIFLGVPVYFFYGLIPKLAFLDGWAGLKANAFLSLYFARSGFLEVFLKKKLGIIKYDSRLEE